MNVRKRGERSGAVGAAPKNTNTSRCDCQSQVSPIKNATTPPKSVGYGKVTNAVNG